MQNTSGLVTLVNAVTTLLAARGVTANVSLGWTKRDQQLNQGPGQANRLVFIPGEGGTLTQPRHSHTNPRVLRSDAIDVVLSVWAVDTSDRTNEAKQIAATENLREDAMNAINDAVDPISGKILGTGSIEWGPRWTWTKDLTEGYFGREMLIPFVYHTPIFRRTYDVCTPQAAIHRDPIAP